MSALERLNVGIVGAAGRGASFKTACDALERIQVHAVCDINTDALDQAAEDLGAREKYTDYEQMLDGSELDAVIIGTPMEFHVPQSILALERGLHVLGEVPAGVSVDECRRLVDVAGRSKGVYMMAENCNYLRQSVIVREMVRQGLFGTPYFAEGEYLHELKQMNEDTPWRRKWQTGINGITYGTHSLGPILQWMPNDRVMSVCCAGSGHHYRDPRGNEYENEDACVMLCRMQSGGLVNIRVDMLSNRPHATTNFQLQGTEGCYESARSDGEHDRIYLKSRCDDPQQWLDLKDLEEEFLPESWKAHLANAEKAGHGGGDYFEVLDFLAAIDGADQAGIGIHEAMDMTLPGLISQQSILEGGRWIDVPDSRQWTAPGPREQLAMVYPAERLSSPPEVSVPEGYRLRQYTDADEAGYLELMTKAGFDGWDSKRIAETRRTVLPGGFFVIEHCSTGRVVATALAHHMPDDEHPCGGALGWVAGDPDHKGKRLGQTVCAAATAKLIRTGYEDIRLLTDDERLPAIKTYLRLGWEPSMHSEGVSERWAAVLDKLGWRR